ncbi:DNA mismatch repair protein MutS [Lactiplantibacillus paraplantarum]|nr:DNA mismatch repair protein MutS [Lactiplantibacillus paraplantarum]MCW1909975.1 DNA mismatch repair protein MutS [Lactiplantibacillus paraplantarum]
MSLLFLEQPPVARPATASCFQDLNLNLIFEQIQQGCPAPIKAIFYQPLTTIEAVKRRQAIFRDLLRPAGYQLMAHFVTAAAETVAKIKQAHHDWTADQRAADLLTALYEQHEQLEKLTEALAHFQPQSLGLQRLQANLDTYLQAPATQKLLTTMRTLTSALAQVQFYLTINGRYVRVTTNQLAASNSAEVAAKLFGPIMTDLSELHRPNDSIKAAEVVNGGTSLQANIVVQLHKLYPAVFAQLTEFYQKYQQYTVPGYEQVVIELNWYLAVQRYTQRLARMNQLDFVLPTLVELGAPEQIEAGFDLELAYVQAGKQTAVVPNDYVLNPNEQFLIVAGPNQGGKTTYIRMIGQAYYLAALGMPIPGSRAKLHLASHVLTHFERQEKATQLTGLLQHDIERLAALYQTVDEHSIVLMNELFSSTTTVDAEKLGQLVLTHLTAKQAHGVYVTFLESLAKLPHMVPMQAQIIAGTTTRAYKIYRCSGTVGTYATSLLNKYQLTTKAIERRLKHASQSNYA